MKNLSFVIWMIGYPFVLSYDDYVNQYLLGKTYSDNTMLISSLIMVAIWIFVGYLLYEKKNED